jgi:hypothetical protein
VIRRLMLQRLLSVAFWPKLTRERPEEPNVRFYTPPQPLVRRVTMDDLHGDGSDCEACPRCECCRTCGDCARYGCGRPDGGPRGRPWAELEG